MTDKAPSRFRLRDALIYPASTAAPGKCQSRGNAGVIEEESGAAPSRRYKPCGIAVSAAPMSAAAKQSLLITFRGHPDAALSAPPDPSVTPFRPPAPLPLANREACVASPSTRKLARELGMDIEAVAGTGPAGTGTHEDVKNASAGPEGCRKARLLQHS